MSLFDWFVPTAWAAPERVIFERCYTVWDFVLHTPNLHWLLVASGITIGLSLLFWFANRHTSITIIVAGMMTWGVFLLLGLDFEPAQFFTTPAVGSSCPMCFMG